MKTRITYGVPGLVAWVAEVPMERARLRVPFAGGAITRYGITPAEYTTDNPVVQLYIEQSPYFKTGKIIKLGEEEICEDNTSS